MTSKHASGTVLQLPVESPLVNGGMTAGLPGLSAVATYDADKDEIVVFTVNRSAASALTLDAAVAGLGNVRVLEAVTYADKVPYWQAGADDSTSVLPSENGNVTVDGGRLTAELAAVSWSMIRLAVNSRPPGREGRGAFMTTAGRRWGGTAWNCTQAIPWLFSSADNLSFVRLEDLHHFQGRGRPAAPRTTITAPRA